MNTQNISHALPDTPTFAHHSGSTRIGLLLTCLVLAASLAVTYQLWQSAQQQALHELQDHFDSRVSKTVSAVEYRMKLYEQVLRGVDGLFADGGGVTRDKFHDYAVRLQLEKNFPGIQGIGYAQIIPAAQKDRHIAATREQGFPDYTIKPEGEREIYTSVIYLEPFSGANLNAFGYDMYSDLAHPRNGDAAPGVRRAAMEQARDSGTTAISGKVRLMMETGTDNQAGFLMYLPVYQRGSLNNTISERRANITGWAYAPFRMGDLMNNMLAGHMNDLDIEIYSGKEILDNALLYRSKIGLNSGKPQNALLKTVKHIEVAGHTWSMTFRSLPGFEAKSG